MSLSLLLPRYLPGLRPVILLDMSGTMHGCQLALRRVIRELLDPKGELTASAMYFDVVVFSRLPAARALIRRLLRKTGCWFAFCGCTRYRFRLYNLAVSLLLKFHIS